MAAVADYRKWLTAGDWSSRRFNAIRIRHSSLAEEYRLCDSGDDQPIVLKNHVGSNRWYTPVEMRVGTPQVADTSQALVIEWPIAEQGIYAWLCSMSHEQRQERVLVDHMIYLSSYATGPIDDRHVYKLSRVRANAETMIWECLAPNLGNLPAGSIYTQDGFPQLNQTEF